jgi:hypothetical protein
MSAIVNSSINLLSQGSGDIRYIRRDASTVIASGITLFFADGGSNFRIKNGVRQIRHEETGRWHSLKMKNNEEGVAVLYWSTNEEAED